MKTKTREQAMPTKITGKPLDVTIETINPELAKMYLKNSKNIRNATDSRIAGYAEDMKNRNWTVNGESLKFDANANLVDGQNRLHACINAGTPFTTLVVRNVATDRDIDTGQSRSIPQLLKGMHGISGGSTVVAAIRCMRMIDDLNPAGLSRRLTHNEIFEFVETLDQDILFSYLDRCRRGHVRGAGNVVAVSYRGWEKDPKLSEEFIESYITGADLPAGHPMIVLRNRYFLADRGVLGTRQARVMHTCLLIKVWNAMRTGDFPTLLVWKPAREKMPEML